MLRRTSARRAHQLVDAMTRGTHTTSRLDNGLLVQTYDGDMPAGAVGFFSRMGTRYENAATCGATGVLESLLYAGNAVRQVPEFSEDLHAIGSGLRCTSEMRELFGWSYSAPRYNLPDALQQLAEVALHPTRDALTFQSAKELTAERMGLANRDATRLTFDLMHQAAYGNVALGRPLWCSPDEMAELSLDTVLDFHAQCVRPERSGIVAAGVSDHAAFCDLVERTVVFPDAPKRAMEFAKDLGYGGGQLLVHNDKAPDSVTKFAEKHLSHVGLIFGTCPGRHPDVYAYLLIQAMLGGGTSFSSGGPGKGMHTKLFREVIAREGWLHGVECVSAAYSSSGIMGLYGQAPPEYTTHLVNMMLYQASTIPERISPSDIEMARNQLMSQLVLLGETRDIAMDETARNLLLHDQLVLPSDLMAGAERVTLDDIRRVCKRMLEEPLTYVVYGDTHRLPDAAQASSMLKAMERKYSTA